MISKDFQSSFSSVYNYKFSRIPKKTFIYIQLLDYIYKNPGKTGNEVYFQAVNRTPNIYTHYGTNQIYARKCTSWSVFLAMFRAGLLSRVRTRNGYVYSITENGIEQLRKAI